MPCASEGAAILTSTIALFYCKVKFYNLVKEEKMILE
jgi:hypothetical protein